MDRLPYVLPQVEALPTNEAIVESLAEHGFEAVLMSVCSEPDLAKFEGLRAFANEVGMALLPMLTISDDLQLHGSAAAQLCVDFLARVERVSLALRISHRDDAKVALQNLATLSEQLRGRVMMLWLNAVEKSADGESIVSDLCELIARIEPTHVCVSAKVPSDDPKMMLGLARQRFGNANLWLALIVKGVEGASGAEYLSAYIPSGDHLRCFTYAAALCGAHGIIMPDTDYLMTHRQDLFKALAAVYSEAKIVSRFWREASRGDDAVSLAVECNGETVDGHSCIRVCRFVIESDGMPEVLLTALRWVSNSAFSLPVSSCRLSICHQLNDRVMGQTLRPYLLRFPSPKRLRTLFKGNCILFYVPDFDIADSVFISSNRSSVEELHRHMNAIAAPVMQYEVQWALKELEMAKTLLNSLKGEVRQMCSECFGRMSECVSLMLQAARRRHIASAIMMAKMFRRQYRELLRRLIFVLEQAQQ
ncbi:MAG: hypothetical protein RMK18_07850 [Armatimonadota bacterium]|nr:hypothetical protein [Armatimonadota bacterium]MCX7778078.1 hypothetical protein [Armatimonadota bacterium]MDW8025757.1 hypothetical protein [Armatimonadota bacterium]